MTGLGTRDYGGCGRENSAGELCCATRKDFRARASAVPGGSEGWGSGNERVAHPMPQLCGASWRQPAATALPDELDAHVRAERRSRLSRRAPGYPR